MKKNIFIILLALTMIFQTVAIYADEETEIKTPQPEPKISSQIVQVSGDSTNVGKPGDILDIRVFVDYTYSDSLFFISGNADAGNNNSVYMLSGSDSVDFRNRYRDNFRISNIGTTSLNFKVQIANNASPGTYPVNIKIRTNDGATGEFTSYVRVEYDEKQASRLELSDIQIMPKSKDIMPGESVAVGFTVKNPTENTIQNVNVKLEGMSESGFTLAKDFNTKNFDKIYPGEDKNVSFVLRAGQNAAAGNYEFKVTLSYFDTQTEGGKGESQKSFFLTINQNYQNLSSVVVENLVTPANTIYPGKTARISFDLTNKGKRIAKRVLVKCGVEGEGLVNKSISQQFIETLNPNESKHFDFDFLATPASSTKNYPINIKVEYYDEFQNDKEPMTTEQYSGIFVSNPDKADGEQGENKISTPKVIVRKYTFNPKLPEAGKEFTMNLEFQNTSSDKVVKNIKISLTSPVGENKESAGSNIFTPVDSSNTFFIDKIAPNGVVSKEIKLYTVPDAIAKTYNVTCGFEYEDTKNNQFKASEEIGIPVVQPSRLEIGEIQTQTEFSVGDGAPLSVSFYNTGKVTLYNMMVRFESNEMEAQNSTYYVGKFMEGATENYDIQVNATEPGEKKGTVVFSYEDSSGEKQEVKKEVTWNVSEAPAFDPNDPMNMPIEEEPTFKDKMKDLLKKWYFWVIIVAIAIAIYVIIKKLKNKKDIKDLTLDV